MKILQHINQILTPALCATFASLAINANAADAIFNNFEYSGQDAYYPQNPLEKGEFYTPILQGCYPDPSICKKGTPLLLNSSRFFMIPSRDPSLLCALI